MDNAKRLLILGGSPFQVPLIKQAKEKGLYVITCDYLPDNPGHKLADEYHNVSTTDKAAVLKLARSLKIDAITSFSSDPAVPTMAYVANELGLSGPSPSAIEALTEKDKFRALMRQAGMNVPDFFTVTLARIPDDADSSCRYIVKPVDSSGSKGITVSDGTAEGLLKCINYALEYSRSGRAVIEGFVEGKQIHGDGFLKNGKLVYHYFGDHFFYTDTNSFIPISTRWPANVSGSVLKATVEQVELIALASGYLDGPVNVEARINDKGVPFIIEVGPRNGGNFVPIIQQKLTGFDFIDACLNLSLGVSVDVYSDVEPKSGAHFIIHASKNGVVNGLNLPLELQSKMFFREIFKDDLTEILPYTGSNQAVGVCLFEFEDPAQLKLEMDKLLYGAT